MKRQKGSSWLATSADRRDLYVGAPEPLEESYPELLPTKQPVDAPSALELEPEPSTVEDIASSSSEAVVEMV